MKSAEVSMGEDADLEETKFDKWVAEKFGDKGTNFIMPWRPCWAAFWRLFCLWWCPLRWPGCWRGSCRWGAGAALIEGVFKLVMLVGYMALVSRMKEIARNVPLPCAEHKTIACYESGRELTVENVRPCTRFHPRCGTSFLLIVILISILAGALITTETHCCALRLSCCFCLS